MPGTLLSLKQCTMQFGGLTAVSAIDLEIGATDLVGLIGPNGAGKTTVFNIVTGVYKPTAGTITFADRSIAGLKPNVIAAFNLRMKHRLAHALMRIPAFYREENDVAEQAIELLDVFDLGRFLDV